MARVVLDDNIPDGIKHFRKLRAKDSLDAGASIIRLFMVENEIDLDIDEANVNLAEPLYQLFLDDEGDAEALLKTLDEDLMPEFAKHIERVQYLKKFYRH